MLLYEKKEHEKKIWPTNSSSRKQEKKCNFPTSNSLIQSLSAKSCFISFIKLSYYIFRKLNSAGGDIA